MVKKILFISSVLFGVLLSEMPRECFADASAQLEQADAYMKDKNYEQAEGIYKQIVTDFPDSNDALEAQKQLTCLYIATDKLIWYKCDSVKSVYFGLLVRTTFTIF